MSAGAACSYVKCKFIHSDGKQKSWRFFLKEEGSKVLKRQVQARVAYRQVSGILF